VKTLTEKLARIIKNKRKEEHLKTCKRNILENSCRVGPSLRASSSRKQHFVDGQFVALETKIRVFNGNHVSGLFVKIFKKIQTFPENKTFFLIN